MLGCAFDVDNRGSCRGARASDGASDWHIFEQPYNSMGVISVRTSASGQHGQHGVISCDSFWP